MALYIIRNLLRQLRHELGSLGSWADEAHVAAQHVEDLRQLVDAELADDRAHARDTRIGVLRPLRAVQLGVLAHAAELQDLEHLAAETDPRLTVQRRRLPAVFDLDGDESQQHRRQRHHQHAETREQVERARGEQTQRVASESLTEDHPAWIEHVDVYSAGLTLEKGEQLGDIDTGETTLEQFRDGETAAPVVHRHHDLGYREPLAQRAQIALGLEHALTGHGALFARRLH